MLLTVLTRQIAAREVLVSSTPRTYPGKPSRRGFLSAKACRRLWAAKYRSGAASTRRTWRVPFAREHRRGTSAVRHRKAGNKAGFELFLQRRWTDLDGILGACPTVSGPYARCWWGVRHVSRLEFCNRWAPRHCKRNKNGVKLVQISQRQTRRRFEGDASKDLNERGDSKPTSLVSLYSYYRFENAVMKKNLKLIWSRVQRTRMSSLHSEKYTQQKKTYQTSSQCFHFHWPV